MLYGLCSLYQNEHSLSGSRPRREKQVEARDGRPEKRVHFDIMNINIIKIQTG